MMGIRLNFIVEGQTEEAFVNQILSPHLTTSSIWTSARCVTTSRKRDVPYRGGITKYTQAAKDIKTWIKEDRKPDARFTTMFDLYRLPADFPGYTDTVRISDAYQRIQYLEAALSEDIGDPRFIPYLQLHEFEALLLSDPQKFHSQFPEHDTGIQRLVELTSRYESPELINDGDQTAPSKRIIDQIPKYRKMKNSIGPVIAEDIGLPTLRSRCAHFGEWLARLEALA